MTDRQVRLFAEQVCGDESAAFVQEIDRQDAWTFARRPLDLGELITSWKNSGRLGTRAEQHDANVVSKLKDDPDRPDNGSVSEAEARQGAERLALALTLTCTRGDLEERALLSGPCP